MSRREQLRTWIANNRPELADGGTSLISFLVLASLWVQYLINSIQASFTAASSASGALEVALINRGLILIIGAVILLVPIWFASRVIGTLTGSIIVYMEREAGLESDDHVAEGS